jgi:hypothetical protein
MYLGHKQTDAPPLVGHRVTVRTRLSGNDAMKTQSPQIISHPARTIRFRAKPQPLRHMIAQGGIAKPLRQQHEQTQRLKQGHDTLIAKPQGGSPLALDDLGSIDPFEGFMAHLAVLADLFDFKASSVGVFMQQLTQILVYHDSGCGWQWGISPSRRVFGYGRSLLLLMTNRGHFMIRRSDVEPR